MKLLEMSDLTVTQRRSSGHVETTQTKPSRRERPRSALPEQTLGDRLLEVREGFKRVILEIWTGRA